MADLCVLSDVKTYLSITTSTDDALLSRLITACSARIEKECARTFAQAAFTDTFDGNDDRVRAQDTVSAFFPAVLSNGRHGWAVNLRNDPVISVTQVMVDGVVVPARPALVSGDTNNALGTAGWVLLNQCRIELWGSGYEFTAGVGNVQIDYQAGYATIPADVADAAIEFVAWRYRAKDRLGEVSKSVGGEVVSYSRADLPPVVQAVVDLYRRIHV